MRLRRRVAALLFVGTLAVSLGTAGAAQASVDPGTSWNEIFAPFQTARSNTLCVDVPGGSKSDGTLLQLFHCHGYGSDGGPQRWQFIYRSTPRGGFPGYEIKNTNSGLCITGAGASSVSGERLKQTACNHAEEWILVSENLFSADPNFGLMDNDGLCIAAGNSSDSNGTPLVATNCFLFASGVQVFNLG